MDRRAAASEPAAKPRQQAAAVTAADTEAGPEPSRRGDPGEAETQVAAAAASSGVAATDAAAEPPQTEMAEAHAAQSQAPSEPPEAETTEQAPNQGAPAAGESGQDEATGFLVLPETESEAEDAVRTFKFPLLQGYRLSACLYGRDDCGEPAASEWCKARGFAGGATAFEIDENIGSLFPTLALGDLQLCASFICDGFKEITCQP